MEAELPEAERTRSLKLSIISYGYVNGPFVPNPSEAKEQLTFSVRDLENPPVRLCKKHTGLSSRLRKEVFVNADARATLEAMVEAVEAKIVCGCECPI